MIIKKNNDKVLPQSLGTKLSPVKMEDKSYVLLRVIQIPARNMNWTREMSKLQTSLAN